MSTFTKTDLAGDRYLVRGTDDSGVQHSTILHSSTYGRLKYEQSVLAAGEVYDQAIKDFFAPLDEALAAAKATLPDRDPAFFIVEQEAVEGTPEQGAIVVELDHATAVLRLIDSGDTSRLIWVGDSIEVLANTAASPGPIAGPQGESFGPPPVSDGMQFTD